MQHFYDGQIRRYATQMMRVLSNFPVIDGDGQTKEVPVMYGDLTRQVANIIRENSENKLPSAPRIAVYITGLELDKDRLTDATYTRKVNIRERAYDEDTKEYLNQEGKNYTVERLIPTPYILRINADIWASNTDQKLQLLEQILVLFNPSLNIHTTNNPFDWTSLSYVELTNMTWSVRSVPSGVDEIIDVSTLQFELPIFISPPVKVQKQTLIHTILNNINQVDDVNLDSFKAGESFTSQFQNYKIITLENYKLRYENGYATLLNEQGGNTDTDGATLNWSKVLPAYGELRDGISQLRLRQSTDPTDSSQDVIGTVSYDAANPQRLQVALDAGTQPANTQGTVDAIINPENAFPGDGTLPAAVSGQRYLILGQTSVAGVWGLSADSNDIITYNGTAWTIAFDASATSNVHFVTNTATGDQYEWTGSQWQNSFEGVYKEGFWRVYL
jgi:hypothetical protein